MGPSSPLMIWWMFVWNFIGRFSLLQGFGHQQETSKSQTAQALGLKSQRLAMIWSSNKINIRRKLEGNYPEDGRSDMSNVGLVAIQRTKSYALGVQFMKTSISWAPRRDSRSILPPVSNMQWLGILRNSLEWPSINYQPLTFCARFNLWWVLWRAPFRIVSVLFGAMWHISVQWIGWPNPSKTFQIHDVTWHPNKTQQFNCLGGVNGMSLCLSNQTSQVDSLQQQEGP